MLPPGSMGKYSPGFFPLLKERVKTRCARVKGENRLSPV